MKHKISRVKISTILTRTSEKSSEKNPPEFAGTEVAEALERFSIIAVVFWMFTVVVGMNAVVAWVYKVVAGK